MVLFWCVLNKINNSARSVIYPNLFRALPHHCSHFRPRDDYHNDCIKSYYYVGLIAIYGNLAGGKTQKSDNNSHNLAFIVLPLLCSC